MFLHFPTNLTASRNTFRKFLKNIPEIAGVQHAALLKMDVQSLIVIGESCISELHLHLLDPSQVPHIYIQCQFYYRIYAAIPCDAKLLAKLCERCVVAAECMHYKNGFYVEKQQEQNRYCSYRKY